MRVLHAPAFHNLHAVGEQFGGAILAFGFHVAAEFWSVAAGAQVHDIAGIYIPMLPGKSKGTRNQTNSENLLIHAYKIQNFGENYPRKGLRRSALT